MEKFNNLRSIPSYLSLQNIDTDMIIPKQFLKTIKRTGLGKSLFYEMRYDEELTKQQIELDAVALEKQKLIDEMNELKGIKKEVNEQKLEVKEKKKTVHAENGPR